MSVVFDHAENQAVQTPAGAGVDNLPALTIFARVKLSEFEIDGVYSIAIKDPLNSYVPALIIQSSNIPGQNGLLFSAHYGTSADSASSGVADVNFNVDQWYSLAATYDFSLPADSRCALYIDGVRQTIVETTAEYDVDDSADGYWIGGDNIVGDTTAGNVAEVAIWNAALSAAEIAAANSSTTGVSNIAPGNLQAYWHLCSTTELGDSSGNGLTGSLVGSPTDGENSPGFSCPVPSAALGTVGVGAYGGNSLAEAFHNPDGMDLLHVVNEGGKVVWYLANDGAVSFIDTGATPKALIGTYYGESFNQAFPNPYSKDILQIIGQGDSVVFSVDSSGNSHS